jgi:DNA modification methylase
MEENKLIIVYVNIGELIPNEYNPKQMSEKEAEELEKSIREFGIVDPIIANCAEGRKGKIIGGHQRFIIYNRMGTTQVPVIWMNIPDLQKERKLCLRLSKTTGSFDYGLLANFAEEELLDVGFSSEDLDHIFGLDMDEEFDEAKEFAKAVKEPRGVAEGEVWQLGDHKLIIGNSTVKENWQKLLGEERFDFMFTDPPYKIGYGVGNRKQKTKDGFKIQKTRTYDTIGATTAEGESLEDKPQVVKFGYKGNRAYQGTTQTGGVPKFDEWLSIAKEFENPKGANVMVFENWKNVIELWQAIEKYWKIRNMIIWHLPNRHQGFSAKYKFFSKYDIAEVGGEVPLNSESEEEIEEYVKDKCQRIMENHEIAMYGSQGTPEWGKMKGRKYWEMGDVISQNAMTEAQSGQNVIFGTKPIQILVPYLKILSPRNGIIMEPFAGSNSTMIACEIMKRKCRAMEISPVYAEICINRWEKFSGKKAQLLA